MLIPKNFKNDTRELICASLAKSTWEKNASALNCLKSFELESKITASWPLDKTVLRNFTTWALMQRKLKPLTVQSYLSSLASIHKLRDLDFSVFDDYIVKRALRGAENLNFYSSMIGGARKVMTLPLLKILGHRISISDWNDWDKQVFWTAATVAFFGSFRFGEILAISQSSFHEAETLLWKDISIKDDTAVIHIKMPKSRKLEGEFVDLFQLRGQGYCPVSALKRLKKMALLSKNDKPVFTLNSGKFLNSTLLNSTLYSLLQPVIGESAAMITGHSFRAALPSALANRPDLASDEDIKLWGRWSSPCYKRYTRLKPMQKRIIFEKIVTSLKFL